MTGFYIFALLFFIISVGIHIYYSECPCITYYSDLIAVIVALLPLLSTLYILPCFENFRLEEKLWLAFFCGLFLWFSGEFLWFYYEGLLDQNPFPSIADIPWILGYFFISVSLILEYRHLDVRLERIYEVGIGLLVLIPSVTVVAFIAFSIAGTAELTALEIGISLFYPLADLLLFFLALLLIGLYWQGKIAYCWMLISMGIIFYGVGDLWFAYLEWMEIYPDILWHPVDFTWILGDLLVFLGVTKFRISLDEVG
jgi:hypothetical protein